MLSFRFHCLPPSLPPFLPPSLLPYRLGDDEVDAVLDSGGEGVDGGEGPGVHVAGGREGGKEGGRDGMREMMVDVEEMVWKGREREGGREGGRKEEKDIDILPP